MNGRWRVRISHHHNFAQDLLNVWVGLKEDDGQIRMIRAIDREGGVTLGDPIDAYAEVTEPSFTVSRELAERIFEVLTPIMLGTDPANIMQMVGSLRRERDQANMRFDKLLEVLSRLGHNTSALTGATVPGGVHPLPKDARQS